MPLSDRAQTHRQTLSVRGQTKGCLRSAGLAVKMGPLRLPATVSLSCPSRPQSLCCLLPVVKAASVLPYVPQHRLGTPSPSFLRHHRSAMDLQLLLSATCTQTHTRVSTCIGTGRNTCTHISTSIHTDVNTHTHTHPHASVQT